VFVAEGLRVKICGLTRREDALAADAAGADYLGVILTAGFGRAVKPSEARAIVEGTRARKVAVLVDETVDAAAEAARALGADVIQLHGNEPPEALEVLRARGAWKLWKAVRARTVEDVAQAVARYGDLADAFLVEGWSEGSLGVGGARVQIEPASVRALVPARATFVLAGGLTPDSVADAVRAFHPDAVDVSSGVERTLRVKDHDKIRAFIEAARTAAAGVSEGASR
jgi:phosphoribosylanthranilate isomerase